MPLNHKNKQRPSYLISDELEKEAYLTSRNDVLYKAFVTELWMKVISKAIDDIALYTCMELENIELKEEDLINKESAVSFLFNSDHRIPLDDYFVTVSCQKCAYKTDNYMSIIASTDYICPFCKAKTSWKSTVYEITEKQSIRDISLQELLSIWGINNINEFREGCKKRILVMIEKKKSQFKNKK